MVLAMTRPTTNRNGTYQTRIGVPANLRDAIGKSELKRSLGTKSESEAKLKHPIVLAEFEATLEQARRSLETESKLTDAIIENIIFAWRKDVATSFHSQAGSIDPYVTSGYQHIESNDEPIHSLLEDIGRLENPKRQQPHLPTPKLNPKKIDSKYKQLNSILQVIFSAELSNTT